MDRRSKIMLAAVLITTIVAVSASFYKSIVLEDFNVVGTWIEIDEDYSYVWFMYNNDEYEFELKSNKLNDIFSEISLTTGVPVSDLNADFIESIKLSYEDAWATLEEK